MIFVALNYGRQKSIFTILVVVTFLDWVCHVLVVDFLHLILDVRFIIIVIGLLPIPNKILNVLDLSFSLWVFIKPCSIVEKRLILVFAYF